MTYAPSPPLTGFSFLLGKANEATTGREAEDILRARGIDINGPVPVRDATATATSEPFGVVKMSNIPFAVTAQEVSQFIQRFSANPTIEKHVSGYPLHIIMEKPTGKTMDCFIEFPSSATAAECVQRFDESNMRNRHRLGARHVSLDLSSQAELMSSLFPRARSVKWDHHTGQPVLQQQPSASFPADGFRGYFTLEEIFGLVKFAETPSRSPFAAKCPQRVYESMISTLYKFPWAATSTYTIRVRNMLFSAVVDQLALLVPKIGHLMQHNQSESFKTDKREIGLSYELLLDLMLAGLNAKAFSLLQRRAICQIVGSDGTGVNLHECAWCWPFQTLEPDESATPASVKFWLELYDTGFDIAQQHDLKTDFEEYCKVSRNKIGFPILEWTQKGLDLSFADAIQLEKDVAVFYIEKGRLQWSLERNVSCFPFMRGAWRNIAGNLPVLERRPTAEASPEISPKNTSYGHIHTNVVQNNMQSHSTSDPSSKSTASDDREAPVVHHNLSNSVGSLVRKVTSIAFDGRQRRLSSSAVHTAPFQSEDPSQSSIGHGRSKSTGARTVQEMLSFDDNKKEQFNVSLPAASFGPVGSSRPLVSAMCIPQPRSRVASRTASSSRRQVSIDHTIHENEYGEEQEYQSEYDHEYDRGVSF